MTFCERLSSLMQEHNNMSKYRLAKELGVHQTTIKNWIDGITTPSASDINKIADYFAVPVDYLLGKTDIKEKPAENGELSEDDIKLIKICHQLPPEFQRAISRLDELSPSQQQALKAVLLSYFSE